MDNKRKEGPLEMETSNGPGESPRGQTLKPAQDPAKLRSPLKNESVVGEESLAEDEDGVPEDMEEAPKLVGNLKASSATNPRASTVSLCSAQEGSPGDRRQTGHTDGADLEDHDGFDSTLGFRDLSKRNQVFNFLTGIIDHAALKTKLGASEDIHFNNHTRSGIAGIEFDTQERDQQVKSQQEEEIGTAFNIQESSTQQRKEGETGHHTRRGETGRPNVQYNIEEELKLKRKQRTVKKENEDEPKEFTDGSPSAVHRVTPDSPKSRFGRDQSGNTSRVQKKSPTVSPNEGETDEKSPRPRQYDLSAEQDDDKDESLLDSNSFVCWKNRKAFDSSVCPDRPHKVQKTDRHSSTVRETPPGFTWHRPHPHPDRTDGQLREGSPGVSSDLTEERESQVVPDTVREDCGLRQKVLHALRRPPPPGQSASGRVFGDSLDTAERHHSGRNIPIQYFHQMYNLKGGYSFDVHHALMGTASRAATEIPKGGEVRTNNDCFIWEAKGPRANRSVIDGRTLNRSPCEAEYAKESFSHVRGHHSASEVEGGSRNLRSDTDHVGADTGAVFRVSEECEDLSRTVDGVTITLHNTALWTAFAGIGTEMIINRGGRRMFPFVSISVSGLDPRAVYSIMLEVVPAAPRRYKFVNKAWMAVGVADAAIKNPPYVHPDSPSSGSFWLERRILFSRVKLTNNKDSREGNMLLHSMHKYVVQITIQQLQDSHGNIVDRPYTFRLDETAFIAVTAYQNDMVTQMKIHNNPFAKAFRDAGYSSV
ncbi:hypothetical protein BaRGS_00027449 [Batillaria attramentaria]|uniref:T-box domain-containing protein n=1 Tax=Batillaria attramentaria TaxID=370345 RepID=A0ABD0K1S0_9CAEN